MMNSKIIQIVSPLLGEFKIIKDHRKGSNRTGVLEIETDNKRIFVKFHYRLNRWNPEVYAYKNWTYVLKEYALGN